jgi:hypothetical protein
MVLPDPHPLKDERHHMEFPVLLKLLPIPEQFVGDVEQLRTKARLRAKRDKDRFEEDLRLRIYFGGMHVACVPTPEGRRVVAAGHPGTGEIGREIAKLDPRQRASVKIESPSHWDELIETANLRVV